MNRLTKSLAIAVTLAIPGFAFASIEVQQLAKNKISITYNASDAATALGREKLEREIRRVAERVCGTQDLRLAGSLRQLQDNRTCYNTAVATALKSIEKSVMG